MTMLRIGAHVGPDDPIAEAAARGADLVQIFLGDPQGWKDPVVAYAGGAAALRAAAEEAGLDLYVHAPYRLNVATANNRIRIPSRKLLGQARGGRGRDRRQGADRARRARAARTTTRSAASTTGPRPSSAGTPPLPVLIENTAGGDGAMARRLDRIARLWEVLEDRVDARRWPGSASAWTPATPTPAARSSPASSTGSRPSPAGSTWCTPTTRGTTFDSGADRHANFGSGQIDGDDLLAVVAAAGAPVVCETPGGAEGQGADIAWLRERLPA